MNGGDRRRLTRTGSQRFSHPRLTGPLRGSPPGRRAAPYTGPSTEAQLVALRNLEGIAIQQASPVPDEIIKEAGEARESRGGFPWPLVIVLAVQAALSARLIWTNTAYADEALYMWAGHAEWGRWLHGAPVPQYAVFFSGSPVLYPPLGALADAAGGLVAARFLSLAFMLGSTCLLWGTTCRLVNRRAALIAAAVFGTLGGTWFLGAYATYDALALLVLNFGTWAAVRASQRRGALGALVLALAGLALGLACAVKYAIALFVPVVVLIVFFAKARERGWGRAVGASLVLVVVFAVTVAAGLHFGGSDYWKGIQFTTLGRAASQASPLTVLKMAYLWTAFIIVLSVIALFASRKEPPAYRWLLRVLALTVYLVPIEQARIDTMVSLDKHVVFGAWFAAIAAGYVLARLSLVDRTQGWMAVVSIPILAFALTESIPQATDMYGRWANLSAFTAAWPGLNAQYPGRYLADTDVYHVLGYYAQGRVGWTQLDSPQNLDPAPSKGMPATQAAIAAHNFSLVIVNTDKASSWAPYDEAIMADMKQSGGYRMVKSADGIEAWASVRQP